MKNFVVTETDELEKGLNKPPKGDKTAVYELHSWQENVYGNSYKIVWQKKDITPPFSIGPL